MTGRVAYAEAGAAIRQAHQRARRAGLGERQWRTLSAVIDRTASYSKLEDRTFLAAIADDVFGADDPTRWQMNKVAEDLKALAAAGIIEREPPRRGRPKKSAAGARYRIALPPAEMHPPAGAIPVEKSTHHRHEKHPPPTRNAPAGGGPTEEVSEESSGERARGAHVSGNGSSPAPTGRPPADDGFADETTTNDNDGGQGDELVARFAARIITPARRLDPGEIADTVAEVATAHGGREVVERFLDWLDAEDVDPLNVGEPSSRWRYPRDLAAQIEANADGVRAELRHEAKAEQEPLRCGRPTTAGRPCRTIVREPGGACDWHAEAAG